jgi:hypothetical protein
MTLQDISRELDSVGRDRCWDESLERAVKRTGREDLRRLTDPCQATCVTCCAIERAHVRHYIGAEDPPAPGSSWSLLDHRAELEAEIGTFEGMTVTRCDNCQRVLNAMNCGCRGGACGVPVEGAADGPAVGMTFQTKSASAGLVGARRRKNACNKDNPHNPEACGKRGASHA